MSATSIDTVPVPSGEPASGPAKRPRARPVGLLAALDDRLNPILVKEVRQALSGKVFRALFVVTSALALILAISQMIDQGLDPGGLSGGRFFQLMYGCLSVAMHLFVPFLAFTSLGNEWDENTFDLLTLSDLRPRVIVFGKLFSAGVQGALYYSAFGPFLVFAFLMRGLDLRIVGLVMGTTVVTSLTLTSLALALSSLSRAKFLRIALMTALAGLLVQATVGSIAASTSLVFFAPDFRDPQVRTAILLFLLGALLLTALNIAIACSRLAHHEENRSSALRVLTVLLVALGLVAAYRVMEFAAHIGPLLALSGGTLAALAAISIFYVAEPERLGRRVEHTIPRNRVLALLSSPFLPGGGLGITFFLLIGSLVLLAFHLIHRWHPLLSASYPDQNQLMLAVGFGYSFTYLGLPSALFSRWTTQPRIAIAARVSIPLFAFLAVIGPAFLGLLLGDESLQNGDHLGNPVHLLQQVATQDPSAYRPGLITLAIVVGVTFALNVPRIARAVAHVLACSRRRQA